MDGLMTIFEMQKRYRDNEDPFGLTIEKWIRIRRFLDTASTVSEFKELFEAANVAVPFCFEYRLKGCAGCPLQQLCGHHSGERLHKIMRLIQFHVFAILSGNVLPKNQLISEIACLLEDLLNVRQDSSGGGTGKN
jgi:hypothetical protein